MLKEKMNALIDYVIGKVVDMVLAKVQSGDLDVFLQEKVDALITELITTEEPTG